eukprot:Gb_04379 [translate_table: standard]
MAAEKVEGRRMEVGELVVGDISISLIAGSNRQEDPMRDMEMDYAFFDYSPHLQQLDILWQESALPPGKSTLFPSVLTKSSVDGLVFPVNHIPLSNCARLGTELDSHSREEGERPMTVEGKEDSGKLSDDSVILPRGDFNSFEDSGQGDKIPGKQGGRVGTKSNLKHAQEKAAREVFQGLCTEVYCKGLGMTFTLLNVYGPYEEKQEYWANLLLTEWIKSKKLIIGGDLNLTLHRGEIWGSSARQDKLEDYFLDKFESIGWVDVDPTKVKPTWTNNRVGEDGVSKRLDTFLVHSDLLERVERYRSWVDSYRCSDHFPIYLEIGFSDPKPGAPFKYNPCWSAEFSLSLRRIKAVAWASERFRARDGLLKEVELRLEELYRGTPEGNFSLEEKTCVTELESKKCKLLLDREKDWRIKSRAIWLQQGDQNTKYFHNYARFRENQNTIWELTGRGGIIKDLAALGVQHFSGIFKEPDRANLGEIIKVVTYFLRMVGDEDNAMLYREITKEELLVVLNALQKEKSPGPDEWSVEVIALRLKPVLSLFISPEHFGFLEGRLIQEAIGTAQEGLHTIKNSHAPAVVIKLDLSKAFDRVSWLYLLLINGSTSPFFKPTRGLRQGCPLSPYLFLLVVEGLSRAIKEAKSQRILQGIKVGRGESITHLLFVDDVLLFCSSSVHKGQSMKDILQLFNAATRMEFLAWRVGNGTQVRLGVDAIMGCGQNIFLPEDLVLQLQLLGRCTLDKIANPLDTTLWRQGSCSRGGILVADQTLEGKCTYKMCGRTWNNTWGYKFCGRKRHWMKTFMSGKHIPFFQTSTQVLALLKVYKSPVEVQKKRVVAELHVDRTKSWGFFDGACLGPESLALLSLENVLYDLVKETCNRGSKVERYIMARALFRQRLTNGEGCGCGPRGRDKVVRSSSTCQHASSSKGRQHVNLGPMASPTNVMEGKDYQPIVRKKMNIQHGITIVVKQYGW